MGTDVNILYYFEERGGDFTASDIATSINSVRLHRDLGRRYNIYVYSSHICSESSKKLSDLSQGLFNVIVRKIDRTTSDKKEVRNCVTRMNSLFDLSTTVSRCVVLDSDILALSDIGVLFDYDIGDKVLAGRIDDDSLHHRPPDYINTGVAVWDLLKLKSYDRDRLISDSISMLYQDQDACNSLPHAEIPREFNWYAWDSGKYKNHKKDLSRIRVLHYISTRKPRGIDTPVELEDLWRSYTPVEVPPRILLCRPFNDLGDSIIFSDVVRTIQHSCPWFAIDVYSPNVPREILDISGGGVTYVSDVDMDKYAGIAKDVMYDISHFVDGRHLVVDAYMKTCNKIPFLKKHLANSVSGVSSIFRDNIHVPENCVVLPSVEPEKPQSHDKWWPWFDDLSVELKKAGYTVIELNTWCDHPKAYRGSSGIIRVTSLSQSAEVFRNAKFSVFIENGMNHWSCHNGGRSYCIFKSRKRTTPSSLFYKTMIPIECYEDESVSHVMSVIKEHEK